MSKIAMRWLVIVGVGLLCSCTRANPAYDPNPELPDECRDGVEVTETITAFARPDRLDILFVIDSSGDDPQALQDVFVDAIGPLGAVIEALEIDARAAVATTDASVGALQACENAVVEIGSGSWDEDLACNMLAEASVSLYDQPLLVVRQLLESPPGDFPRDDARLLVVIASRSDDCTSASALSGDPREACATAELEGVGKLLDQWHTHRGRDEIGLVVFAGPPSNLAAEEGRPVCNATLGSVLSSIRLFDATQFVDFGVFHSLCTDDVSVPLLNAVEAFVTDVGLTFCPEAGLTQEPLAVLADGDALPLGEAGFTYAGATGRCPTGAIRFAADAVRAVDEIEVTYCTPE